MAEKADGGTGKWEKVRVGSWAGKQSSRYCLLSCEAVKLWGSKHAELVLSAFQFDFIMFYVHLLCRGQILKL